MKRLSLFLVMAGVLLPRPALPIDSIGLFKNGLAVVRISTTIPDSGKRELLSPPDPVHGTFWIQSEKPVTARVAIQPVDAPLAAITQPELLQHLIGKTVTLHLENDTLTGKLLGETRQQRKEWSRDYVSVNGQPSWRYWWNTGSSNATGTITPPSLTFLQTEDGRVVSLQPGQIQRVEFGQLPTIQRERSVLLLESQGAGEVRVEYLTKGISWAPSYRIDITDPETLSIRQNSVIRNELTDLRNVEFRLISGFPSVRFGSVDSPISTRQSWAEFFRQLSNLDSNANAGNLLTNSGILAQQVFTQVGHGGSGQPRGPQLGEADEGESVDLHYQSIGRHSLAPGESLAIDVAEKQAKYERVVEWNIPDTRAANGRYLNDYQRQQNRDRFDETAWDAIVFPNPFDFPMTTAPAMLVQDGQFQGQQTSTWTNPRAETSVRITKALSVTTRSVEHEVPESRKNLRIAGNDFYRVQVQGELTVKNHRGKPVKMSIKRRFSGELLEADEEPEKELLEIGIYSINKRNELHWRIDLAPGEEKTIDYRYEVLVDN